MWTKLARFLPTFASVVLNARDERGYPLSVRCHPVLDTASRTLRFAAPVGVTIAPGPASILGHEHDEQLWNQRSFLARGTVAVAGDEIIFTPTEFVPGMGITGLRGFIGVIRRARRDADRYLAKRQLARPAIPWEEINRIKDRALPPPEHSPFPLAATLTAALFALGATVIIRRRGRRA